MEHDPARYLNDPNDYEPTLKAAVLMLATEREKREGRVE